MVQVSSVDEALCAERADASAFEYVVECQSTLPQRSAGLELRQVEIFEAGEQADLEVAEPADQTDIELSFLPPFHPACPSSVVHVFALRLHSVALAEGRKEAAHSREGQAAIGSGPHVG